MQWDRGHESRDVDDERGRRSVGGGMGAGSIISLFRFASMFGWKGIVVAGVLVGGAFVATNVAGLLPAAAPDATSDERLHFVSFVLDDVQASWDAAIPGYHHAKLVVFRNQYPTACGRGEAAMGPFYCPNDQQVYIDLAFYDELSNRFGAPGDFAEAYVVAHEVGHHVQHLQGLDRKVPQNGRAQGASGPSVRLELQADCFAGVWAASAQKRGVLDAGDLQEGLRAATAIGDDRLQQEGQGRVVPDSFTHGTSEQRSSWLKRGYDGGSIGSCDTWTANPL
jgi:predicted metalloprotease